MRTMAYYPQPQFWQGYYPQPPMQDHLAQLRSQQQNPILWVSGEQEVDQFPIIAETELTVIPDMDAEIFLRRPES